MVVAPRGLLAVERPALEAVVEDADDAVAELNRTGMGMAWPRVGCCVAAKRDVVPLRRKPAGQEGGAARRVSLGERIVTLTRV